MATRAVGECGATRGTEDRPVWAWVVYHDVKLGQQETFEQLVEQHLEETGVHWFGSVKLQEDGSVERCCMLVWPGRGSEPRWWDRLSLGLPPERIEEMDTVSCSRLTWELRFAKELAIVLQGGDLFGAVPTTGARAQLRISCDVDATSG
jgi:hypothetical protein